MSSPELRPLLPLSARSISWTDILFPPVCLACALALHILYNPQFGDNQRHSHLYRMTTQHARFLPEESKHAFHYNTIHIGVDLDALERKHLDIGDRWFAYNPRRWTLLGLNDLMFSSLPTSSSELKAAARVRRHLLERGIPAGHMDNIYTIAMPTFAGFEGINPLVIHYCYSTSAHRSLRVVVLEVHNTFEERHIYVLQVGKNEDERPSSG